MRHDCRFFKKKSSSDINKQTKKIIRCSLPYVGTPALPPCASMGIFKRLLPVCGGMEMLCPLCLARSQTISLGHRAGSIDEAKNGRTHAKGLRYNNTTVVCSYISAHYPVA